MGRGPWRTATIVRAASALAALGAMTACSLIVNRTAQECSVDLDCADFPGATCVQGGCVVETVAPEGGLLDALGTEPTNVPCTTTQDCLALHANADWICRKPDDVCVELTSADCPTVAGDYTGDDALIMGAILPLYGPHASTGAMLVNAIKLGLGDFVTTGIPPTSDGGLPRQMAVVFCDESVNPVSAAMHLQSELGLATVLGTGEGATTLSVVNGVTFQSGQFLISPRATVDLGAYQTDDTVWRTCASESIEGAALARLIESVSADVATQRSLSSASVAILHASDTESTELNATITGSFAADGGAPAPDVVLDVSYGDPDTDSDPQAEYAAAISQITTQPSGPDIVVVLGSTQAVKGVVGGLESGWPAQFPQRPFYVLSSGLQTLELLDLVDGNDDLRARILGTAPGANASSYTNLARFLALYGETFADGGAPITFGVAQAYDALYTVAYAAATARNTDLNGTDVSTALKTLLWTAAPDAGADAAANDAGDAAPPAPIDVGPSGISAVFQAIAAHQKVQLAGASAPLAFDVATGNVLTDVQVWCIVDSSTGVGFVHSGQAYEPATGALVGALGNGCKD